jgi:2-polyprenyl-6-methoxyphenol hydroxylase-like FAD-dependent oxidoreductase
MMLGLLLARAGVDVLVLEKHADFLRDFRGDTIHPSTLEVMGDLGLLDRFLALPHERVYRISARIGDTLVPVADFDHLPARCRFVAFMPQWDFLSFLAEEGRRHPTFRLWMRAEVTGLLEDADRVTGVEIAAPGRPRAVRASLVVAADGRSSLVRARAGLEVEELGAPMDVLWFRLSRRPDDGAQTMGRFDAGRIFVMINRGEHWQCGYVIAKGSLDATRRGGLDAFRREVARLAPFAADRVGELRGWDQVKLLTVRVDRARRWWRPGLLCIGDAAHAMSPIGGVGINLAIQDAVAAANLLALPLREDRVAPADLQAVQRRREWPTRVTQRIQVLLQDRVITRVLGGRGPIRPPLALRVLACLPLLRRVPGRLVGMGIRPERVAPDLRSPGGRLGSRAGSR